MEEHIEVYIGAFKDGFRTVIEGCKELMIVDTQYTLDGLTDSQRLELLKYRADKQAEIMKSISDVVVQVVREMKGK